MVDLSEFEQRRLQNMERNAAFLKELGLDATKESIKASNNGDVIVNKKKRKSRSQIEVDGDALYLPEELERKSLRVRGLPSKVINKCESERHDVDVTQRKPKTSMLDVVDLDIDDECTSRRKISAESLRSFINNANETHSELLSNNDIIHTVYRICSMSIPALKNRVKMISSSLSKTSMLKMLCFYYGLLHANLLEIANIAKKCLVSGYKISMDSTIDDSISGVLHEGNDNNGEERMKSEDIEIKVNNSIKEVIKLGNDMDNSNNNMKDNKEICPLTALKKKAKTTSNTNTFTLSIVLKEFLMKHFPELFHNNYENHVVIDRKYVNMLIWKYIKNNKLQNDKNKREIICDSELFALLQVKK